MAIKFLLAFGQASTRLMKTLKFAAGGVACGLVLATFLSQPVSAQVRRTEHFQVQVQVVAVDHTARTLTVRQPDGSESIAKIGPDAKNFDSIKVGDNVTLDFMHSVLFELRAAEDLSMAGNATVARAPVGSTPSAVASTQLSVTVKIIAIDKKNHDVTLEGPKGNHVMYHVQDPTLRKDLDKLKPGQVIRATFNDAVAATVTPSN